MNSVAARQIVSISLSSTLAVLVSATQGMATPSFMGTGSCASSNCHGSVSPRQGTNVLQNEYVTWQKHDLHSKAYLNLGNEDSRIIASHLGIADAQKDSWCLSCHATYNPAGKQGVTFTLEDGVGCESCHGAAENYLGSHTAQDASHAQNLQNGMKDIGSASNRAQLCVSCHIGEGDQMVNHRLIGAGHPRLTFELDTFSQLQPKHWLVDDDYRSRKSDYSPVQAWLVGQVAVARSMLTTLADPDKSSDGPWPEFTLFYCYSCHHSLSENQWKSRNYDGKPGEMRLNIASLIVLREATRTVAPAAAHTLEQALVGVHSGYRAGKGAQIAKDLLKTLRSLEQELSKRSYSTADQKALLKTVLQFGATARDLPYEVAEQITMGTSSIISALSPDGSKNKAEVDSLYAALRDPNTFQPEEFTAACQRFVTAI